MPRDQHGQKKRDPVPVQQCLMLTEQLPQCKVHDNDHCNIQTLRQILHLPDVRAEQHDNETDGKIPLGNKSPSSSQISLPQNSANKNHGMPQLGMPSAGLPLAQNRVMAL